MKKYFPNQNSGEIVALNFRTEHMEYNKYTFKKEIRLNTNAHFGGKHRSI